MSTNLGSQSLLIVDNATPPKVQVIVLDSHESSRLKEGQRVGGMIQHVSKILDQDVELLSEIVVVRNGLLIFDENG